MWRKKSSCINYEGQLPEVQSYLDVHVNTLTEENLPSIVGVKSSPSPHFGSLLPLTETLLPQQRAAESVCTLVQICVQLQLCL